MDQLSIEILGVLALATFFHGIVGFGTASIAMPLLVGVFKLLDFRSATALVGLVILIVVLWLLAATWRELDRAAVRRLVLSSIAGIPVGMAILVFAGEHALKHLLGTVVIASSLWQLAGRRVSVGAGAALLAGFAGGVFGVACNTNAPPVVSYCAAQDWSSEKLQATLQAYFLIAGACFTLGHFSLGYITAPVAKTGGLALLVIPASVSLGRTVKRRIPEARFRTLIHVTLVALGLALFL